MENIELTIDCFLTFKEQNIKCTVYIMVRCRAGLENVMIIFVPYRFKCGGMIVTLINI